MIEINENPVHPCYCYHVIYFHAFPGLTMKKTSIHIAFITVILLLFAAGQCYAVGFKAGLYFPGGMTVSGSQSRDFDTDSGLTFGVFTHIRSGDNLLISPFADYTSFKNGAGDAITLTDLGADLKLKLATRGMRVGAGAALGLGNLEADPQIKFVSKSANTFLVYRGFIEKDFDKIIAEAGLKGYSGGNEEDVEIHPGLYLRVGVLLD